MKVCLKHYLEKNFFQEIDPYFFIWLDVFQTVLTLFFYVSRSGYQLSQLLDFVVKRRVFSL